MFCASWGSRCILMCICFVYELFVCFLHVSKSQQWKFAVLCVRIFVSAPSRVEVQVDSISPKGCVCVCGVWKLWEHIKVEIHKCLHMDFCFSLCCILHQMLGCVIQAVANKWDEIRVVGCLSVHFRPMQDLSGSPILFGLVPSLKTMFPAQPDTRIVRLNFLATVLHPILPDCRSKRLQTV